MGRSMMRATRWIDCKSWPVNSLLMCSISMGESGKARFSEYPSGVIKTHILQTGTPVRILRARSASAPVYQDPFVREDEVPSHQHHLEDEALIPSSEGCLELCWRPFGHEHFQDNCFFHIDFLLELFPYI